MIGLAAESKYNVHLCHEDLLLAHITIQSYPFSSTLTVPIAGNSPGNNSSALNGIFLMVRNLNIGNEIKYQTFTLFLKNCLNILGNYFRI